MKAATNKPVFMKLTPNVTDIAEIARACADAGADGLCLINTLLGMRIDLKSRRPLLANRTGGSPAPPCSRWRCGWCGMYMRRFICPSSAAAGALCRGRGRDDAGRRLCRGGGRRQFEGPLRLQDHCGKSACRLPAAGRDQYF